MQKILKNERGSVALFVLLSALFFLVVVTGVAVSFKNKEAQIDSQFEKIKLSYEKDANQVYNEAIKDNSELEEQPDGTFKDSKGNEWVWIEVPKSVTVSATTDAQIEAALRAYVAEDDFIITGTIGDSYTTTTGGYTDTWYDGCGLSESEYNTTKSKMLNSIKDNGGFYIGKYETGIENSYRTYAKGEEYLSINEEYPATETAVIKSNAYPYNYVTCSQAENLAKGFATDGKTASLLFGIQWDLVLKYINEKGEKTVAQLTNDSTSWGNYSINESFSITSESAKSSSNNGETYNSIAKDTVKSGTLLLTTGSSTSLAPLNIYDLAGNVGEWTLEQSSDSSHPSAAYRGGIYDNDGGTNVASFRTSTSVWDYDIGFRVALY